MNFAAEPHGKWIEYKVCNHCLHMSPKLSKFNSWEPLSLSPEAIDFASLAKTRRCRRRRLCRADCHNTINQMRLAMTTVRSPPPTVATAASREQTLSRVYCNVRLPWQPACSPLPKQQRNENILLSSHPSPLRFVGFFFYHLSPNSHCTLSTGSV